MPSTRVRASRSIVAAVIAVTLWHAGMPARGAEPPAPGASGLYRPGELIVKFRPQASPALRQRALAQVGAPSAKGARTVRARVAVGGETAAAQRLSRHPAVAWAEPNYIAMAFDHTIGEVGWGTGDAGVKAEQVWAPLGGGFTGTGVRVAVIDSGVDASHAQLAGRVEALAPYDGGDDCGHGTAVAGVIAAAHDGVQTAGVAPDATILSLKALHFDDSAGECIGDAATVAAAIRLAADPAAGGADVINLSLGLPRSRVVAEAVHYATNSGVTVVAAAGDSGDRAAFSPAAEPDAISVGALARPGDTGDTLVHDPTSSFGKVDIAAPGRHIPVIQATGVRASRIGGACPEDDPQPLCSSGTSFAAPHVAGVAALLTQQHRADLAAEALPQRRPWMVRQWLLGTAMGTGPNAGAFPAPVKLTTGHGGVDASQAVKGSAQASRTLVTWSASKRVLSPTAALRGTPYSAPAAIRVSSGTGQPSEGVLITLSSTAGLGSSEEQLVTGADGTAALTLTGIAQATTQSVTAAAGDISLPLKMLILHRDDNIPGETRPTTSSGVLNGRTDLHDVYRFRLTEGEILRAHLRDVSAADYLDMNVFGPGATNVITSTPLREGGDAQYDPLVLRRTASRDGTHYAAVTGTGAYRLKWTIESPAVMSPVATSPHTITPNGDGYADSTRLSWRTVKAGRIVVSIVDDQGRTRRTMSLGYVDPGARSVRWDGRTGTGSRVANSIYSAVVRWEDGRGRFCTKRVPVRVTGA